MIVNNVEEYKMLRTEILQYLQHYQNIRTFMFTSATAIFTFLFKDPIAKEPLMYLLPLLVVIPTYLSAVNYWLCVTVDAAYLMVFHEDEEYRGQYGQQQHQRQQGKGREDSGCGQQEKQCVTFHWETRHSQFSNFSNFNEAGESDKTGRTASTSPTNRNARNVKISSLLYSWLIENIQPLAYILVTAVCFVAYGYFLYQKSISTIYVCHSVATIGKILIVAKMILGNIPFLDKVILGAGDIAGTAGIAVGISVDIVVGVITFIICFCIFAFVRVKGKDKYVEQWRRVRDAEIARSLE